MNIKRFYKNTSYLFLVAYILEKVTFCTSTINVGIFVLVFPSNIDVLQHSQLLKEFDPNLSISNSEHFPSFSLEIKRGSYAFLWPCRWESVLGKYSRELVGTCELACPAWIGLWLFSALWLSPCGKVDFCCNIINFSKEAAEWNFM